MRRLQIIKRQAEHYDTQEMEFGWVYKWQPESVIVECGCGKRMTFKRSELIGSAATTCECGKENMATVREEVAMQLLDEDYETHHHPWRYWHPPKDAGIPF